MAEPYDAEWADGMVAELHERGVQFAPGLDAAALDAIAGAFGVRVPKELEALLLAGVPVSPGWARWVDGAEEVAEEARGWIEGRFAFDIKQNHYWHPLFGERPESDPDAVAQAVSFLSTAPPLFPLYSHRFLTTGAPGRQAVLSVWQPVDSIFYGNDLADYLSHEFAVDRPSWAASRPPRVPVWEDLFGLFRPTPP